MNPTQKVVLITGASSGIGSAAALAFIRAGAHVTVTARRAERLTELAQAVAALPEPHGDLLPITADVTDAAALMDAVAQTVARFGRLDVLIANAGIGQRGAVVDAPWGDLEPLLRTNIDGVLHSVRAAAPAMRAVGGGQIVIVSSVMSNMTAPYSACYAASKAFVSSLAASLRLELERDKIAVIDLRVGRTATEFHEKRLGAAGYAVKAPRLPVMTAERVAAAIIHAVDQPRPVIALRWIDRLIIWANALIPEWVGRRALRQYRTD